MEWENLSDNTIPEYVDYLMSPDTPLDFHINVGFSNETRKRFGVDKWMLAARSKVFRLMIHQSPLKHDKEFDITDLEPHTFQHFLIYIYGVNNTADLTFNDSVDLLSAAEKYDVADLKTKLGKIITSQVDSSNVFVVLKNAPVCEKVPELWEAVTEVIQYNTGEIFSNPQFLEAKKEVLLHIVQQDSLNVPEIEVWKAALNWATFQGQEDIITPGNLRRTLLPMLKHIRLCSLSFDELGTHVLTTGILNHDEIVSISSSIAQQKKSDKLTNVCSEIEQRNITLGPTAECFESESSLDNKNYFSKITYVTLQVNQCDILLCSVEFLLNTHLPSDPPEPISESQGKITITCESDLSLNALEIRFNRKISDGSRFLLPVRAKLKSNKKYKVAFELPNHSRTFFQGGTGEMLPLKYFTLEFGRYQSLTSGSTFYGCSFKKLWYKVLK